MLVRGDRAGRLHARRAGRDLARHRRLGVRPRRPLPARPRDAASSTRDGMSELLLGWLDALSDRLDRGPARRGRRRRASIAFTAAAGDRVQIIGDDYLVTNAERVRQARRAAAPATRVLVKPNQARHADRDQGGARRGERRRLGRDRLGPLGRDRGRDHRPSRGRLGRASSSRSARSPAPSAWRSGTRGCASRRRWATARCRRARRFRGGRAGRSLLPAWPSSAMIGSPAWMMTTTTSAI